MGIPKGRKLRDRLESQAEGNREHRGGKIYFSLTD